MVGVVDDRAQDPGRDIAVLAVHLGRLVVRPEIREQLIGSMIAHELVTALVRQPPEHVQIFALEQPPDTVQNERLGGSRHVLGEQFLAGRHRARHEAS